MFSYDWQQLHNKPIFCGWKRRENGSKLPMSAVTGKAAKVNEPNTFCTYRQAVNYCNTHSYIEGVGFRLAPIDENYAIWGIDVDCHDSEAGANPLQTEIFAMFRDTYAEYSPSGKGIHIIGLARRDKLPATPKEVKDFEARYYKKNSKLDVECYIDGVTDRYLTYTGRRVEGAAPAVTDMTDTLLLFLDRYMQRDKLAPAVAPVPTRPAPAAVVAAPAEALEQIDLNDRLDKARHSVKGSQFCKLYDLGDWNGYRSQSEARQRLCGMLAFWLGKDRTLMIQAYQQSALWRADKAHDLGCIDNAIATCTSVYTQKTKKKHTQKEGEGEEYPALTLDLFREWINSRYSVFYDLVSHRCKYVGICKGHPMFAENTAPTYLEAEAEKEFTSVSISKVERLLNSVISENTKNPILEKLSETVWDGVDRLQEVFKLFRIDTDSEDDQLSRSFFKKWLMQAVAMLFNGEDGNYFAPEFVLVLHGGQGKGKTRFFEHLARAFGNEYWGEGMLLDPSNKDSVMQATSVWICELGEMGGTMKKDIDRIKSFMTLPEDEYRAPYDRKKQRYPRKTSFIGTVNDEQFLPDTTGNRRWAVVELPADLKLDYERDIMPINGRQVWAQVYQIILNAVENGETLGGCFRLTDEENKAQALRNTAHEKPLRSEREVEDVLAEQSTLSERDKHGEGKIVYMYMTVSQFKEWNEKTLRQYTVTEISKVLKKLGYTQVNQRICLNPNEPKKVMKCYKLPRKVFNDSCAQQESIYPVNDIPAALTVTVGELDDFEEIT